MKSEKIKTITFTGLFAALVFLATYMLHVPAGINGGYVHFGDALIYAAASMLPLPNAMIASAIGASLSDILSPGAAMWALPTAVIKALCCLPFTCKAERMLARRNICALAVAGLITALGYGAVTAAVSGNVMVAVAELPLSLVQAGGSAACYVLLALALDKIKIKKALYGRGN